MSESFFYSVKDLSKDENLVVSYFFYKLCLDVESFRDYNEAQSLYNALVSALGLEEHAEKVIGAVNEKHVNAKTLTPYERRKEDHPFEMLGDIKFHYKEDTVIERKCGSWDTKTSEEIDLVRAVFAGKKEDFAEIIAYTFFYKQNTKLKIFTIPEKIHIPARIIALSKKTDRVRFLIDSLKLTGEEGRILNIAYLFHSIKESYAFCRAISHGNDESRGLCFMENV